MTDRLAHNLDARRSSVFEAFPGTTVFWIGDQAHQAECSDHNPDATGVVHAIDVMLAVGPDATAVLNWCLDAPGDLEYVIHNRTIWTRKAGFRPAPYDGADPHTNHVHISGRHGTAGNVPHVTCTGYDRAAEALTPEGFDIMTPAQLATIVAEIRALPAATALAIVQQSVDSHHVTVGLGVEATVDTVAPNTDLMVSALTAANTTLAQIAANTTPITPAPTP